MTKLTEKLRPILQLFITSYMPRWIIFGIDLMIVALAFSSLWFFRDTVASHKGELFSLKILLAISFYTFTSLVFRTYRGVVRFSTVHDLRKLTQSSIVASLLFLGASIIFNNLYSEIPTFTEFNLLFPIIFGFMVMAGQLLMRFTVRSVFETLESNTYVELKTKVFVLGADTESIKLAIQIQGEKSNPYKPVAFITFSNGLLNKSVCGLPIIEVNGNITTLMARYKVKSMLVTKAQLDSVSKEFYDKCIVEGLELLLVNMISRYNQEDIPPQINRIKIEDLLGRNAIEMDREAIQDQFTDQVILITGAGGSIGSEIARQVVHFNCKKIVLIDQAETPLNDLWLELSALHTSVEIKPIVANVSNRNRMGQIFECAKPSLVFHAAAYKHVPMMESHPSTAVVTNVLGTKICADLSVENGVKRFVMISTDKAVNPTNVMGASKRAAEIYVQSLYFKQLESNATSPTQFVTTRFGNVLGSNGSVVPLFKRQIESGGPVTITHKEITRYFMTIPEACSLVLEAGCTGKGGEIYIFDMGEAVRIYELAEKMIRLSGKVPGKDISIVEIGLRPGEKLFEELLATKENTLPTYHKKVMIAKVRRYPYIYAEPEINDMIDVALKYIHPEEVVLRLKILIPEFKSKHSVYEAIDKKLEAGSHENIYTKYVYDK
ncbi:MAG: nucleoside-diphosphate sugar epimerase/dehydratase [Bacteroidales bacterium]|nr:nucleoside-diphosphate sugar epimerase/dehydratase [Bacteroidales bacterium]